MALEIERKFLVTSDSWRAAATLCTPMFQGYLASDPSCSVRVRLEGDKAYLNIKGATLGIQRSEYEYPIPPGDAQEMLNRFCHSGQVIKKRYSVPHAGHLWEVDVFEGANSGLVVAELELAAVNEPFVKPDWVGEEVSNDPRYYNVCLAQNPYGQW